MPIKDRIVAEVTRNWYSPYEKLDPPKPLVSQQFEKIIATNKGRGYKLEDWKFQSVTDSMGISETIVAVFTKENEPT